MTWCAKLLTLRMLRSDSRLQRREIEDEQTLTGGPRGRARAWRRGRRVLQRIAAGSGRRGRHRERRMAVSGRRRGQHAVLAARPGDGREFRDAHRGVALEPFGRRRPADRARDAELRRRQAVQRRRPASARHLDGSGERQAALEFRRARNLSLEVLDARRVRQGRGVSRDRRPRRHLHHDARVSSCSRSTRRPDSRSRTGAVR